MTKPGSPRGRRRSVDTAAGAAQPQFDFARAHATDTVESPRQTAPLAVSELVGLVAETLEKGFARVLVTGEISSFKRAASGHCYFTLCDDDASIDAVMWRGEAAHVAFEPRVGDAVVCRGRVGVYEKQGRMQLYASSMQPVGAGAAQRALEELKRRLAAEGLFATERKRPLPYLPRTIGVVTSRSGAALHDILTTINRRFRGCHVVLSPAAVQGAEAPGQLVAALAALADFGRCDVVILGRGGGAVEDLAAFNDEAVVRAVAACEVPVVSAVGHEVDFTLCDLAADYRAATPTAAAEAVVPVHAELAEEASALELRLEAAVRRHVEHLRDRVDGASGRLRDPASLVAGGRQRADEMFIRLERALVDRHRAARLDVLRLGETVHGLGRDYTEGLLQRLRELNTRMLGAVAARRLAAETTFATLRSKLAAMSPLAVLERGYSLASRADGRLVRRANELTPGEELRLRFAEGLARTRVISTEGD